MSSSVTVLGSDNSMITLSFDSSSTFTLARQLADLINTSVTGGANYITAFDSVPAPALPRGYVGGYYQQQTNFSLMPSGYVVDLVKTPGAAFVQSSDKANQIIMSDENTALTFVAAAGSGTVVAGGAASHLFVAQEASGSWNLNTGTGDDVIQALGSGNDTVNAGLGNNLIVLGSGSDFVAATGNDSIIALGKSATINAFGAHSTQVSGGRSDLIFVGGMGGATIDGGSGSDTYLGAAAVGAEQVVRGGSAGKNLLIAGNGPATLFGGGNKDELYAIGSAAQVLRAADGNETLSAAGSTGSTTLAGGSGHTVLVAGQGSTTFEFIQGMKGQDVVQGLTSFSNFTIHLTNYQPSEVTQALATQKSQHGSTTISLSDGTKVTFENISHLTRSDFS
ncbi:MAG: hypothetical protein JSS43_01320 [Proteobacteria bacterium]|nr:hypothetical protein [Pseudomonadota bacterium]